MSFKSRLTTLKRLELRVFGTVEERRREAELEKRIVDPAHVTDEEWAALSVVKHVVRPPPDAGAPDTDDVDLTEAEWKRLQREMSEGTPLPGTAR